MEMTQEEKELFLKDLCARLPYHTKIDTGAEGISTLDSCWYEINRMNLECGNDIFLPYLRPMSSMTSKEWVEFCDCSLKDEMSWVWTENRQKFIPVQNREDYLNSKHFDHRGLIPMGLALKALEGMYK